jgi:hypothetical protein
MRPITMHFGTFIMLERAHILPPQAFAPSARLALTVRLESDRVLHGISTATHPAKEVLGSNSR